MKTAVGTNNPDTVLIIDKLVSALEEIYDIAEGITSDKDEADNIFRVIERVLDDYKEKYGKNAQRGSTGE